MRIRGAICSAFRDAKEQRVMHRRWGGIEKGLDKMDLIPKILAGRQDKSPLFAHHQINKRLFSSIEGGRFLIHAKHSFGL